MIERIEIQWLLSFQAVYEALSVKHAAEERQLPTSNISRHISLLEQTLNLKLLERTTRKIIPTEAGRQLYRSLTPLLQQMENTLEEVTKKSHSISGSLKIIAPDLPFLGQVFAEFCQQYPQVSLNCETQLNPQEGIIDGYDLILGFNRGKLPDSNWVAKDLLSWPSTIVASPKLLSKFTPPQTINELSQVPCITSLSILEGKPWRFKDDIVAKVQSRFKVNSGQMAKSAAIKGLGFAILPKQSCEQEIQKGELIEITLNEEPEDLVLYALYSGKPAPKHKVKAMIEQLQLALKKME